MHRTTTRIVITFIVSAVTLGAASAAAPRGWELRTPPQPITAETGLDRTVFHGGKVSGYLKVTGPSAPRPDLSMRQPVRADRYRGQRVRLSAYLKTAGVSADARSGVGLFLNALGDTQLLAVATMADHPIRGDTGWMRYEEVLDVPAETRVIRFGVTLYGTGQVWIDDVKLEIVGADVPTTAGPVPPRTAEQLQTLRDDVQRLLATGLPQEPVNLDFEQ